MPPGRSELGLLRISTDEGVEGHAFLGSSNRGASQASNPPADHAQHAHVSRARMSWARLLKRVFDIDIEHCPNCGGAVADHRRHRRSAGEGANPRPSGLANSGAATLAGAPTRSLSGSLSIRHHFAGSADGRARPALARNRRSGKKAISGGPAPPRIVL